MIREADDALAYALTRLPATYAACATVFAEAARMAPGFAPQQPAGRRRRAGRGELGGAGGLARPGDARPGWTPARRSWRWPRSSPPTARRRCATPTAQRADLTAAGRWPRADLVVASYALAEIAPDRQAARGAALWDACDGVLALVEPGTPAGYAPHPGRPRRADRGRRDHPRALPARRACPLVAPDWCHFSVRLPRSRDHRLAKGAEVPFEDETFAYLVVARPR